MPKKPRNGKVQIGLFEGSFRMLLPANKIPLVGKMRNWAFGLTADAEKISSTVKKETAG